jgi:hypothetical protein
MTTHLCTEASAALALTNSERIRYARNEPWIWYPRAEEILRLLEDLLDHPKSHRMPCMLVVGRTNNGKTAIAQQFLTLHAPVYDPSAEADVVPVLYLQAPPVPDERRLNAIMLDKLRISHKTNERADRMMEQLLHVMPRLGVKMLMIDEIHHVLAGNRERQRAFLQVLKYIGGELNLPIVALGTSDALFALQADAQLANRFVPTPLPEWKLDRPYLSLLASFEKLLPLRKPSNLTEAQLATRLLSMSEGTIGELARLLSVASVRAIENKSEQISLALLEQLHWVEPSERRNHAARLL